MTYKLASYKGENFLEIEYLGKIWRYSLNTKESISEGDFSRIYLGKEIPFSKKLNFPDDPEPSGFSRLVQSLKSLIFRR